VSGTGIRVDDADLLRLCDRLNQLASLTDRDLIPLLRDAGALVESQTRRRIEDEEGAPDSTPWEPWSARYLNTRHDNQQILIGEGDLLDSITWELTGDGVEIGTNLIYGAIHQFGGEAVGIPIPERPYLGLSPDNMDELEQLTTEFFNRILQ